MNLQRKRSETILVVEMWWLIPIAVVGVGKVIYDLANEPARINSTQKTVLETNLGRLSVQLRSQRGRKIAILGQPGAGKSSLLKGMTSGVIDPLPIIGAQTDATNWSIDPDCSLLSKHREYIFTDVPGYDTESHPTDVFTSLFPWDQFDAFIFVLRGKLHQADEIIYKYVARQGKKVFLARSFSESLSEPDRAAVDSDLRVRFSVSPHTKFFFFSNRTGEGVVDIYHAIQQDAET
ncbi:Rab family GTPase [Delftia acidovorans]|uniref:Rab family GTPase n=1 Tax=Delftia acidovorans TaxID=80866 RepID=UPI001EE09B53|nr:GTPase [Delftia acidovorans]MCG3786135.1 50S ribosome-binding GTPase [Delftia acidovorans]